MSAWAVTMGAGATMGSCIRHVPFHAGVGEGLRVSYGRQQWQNTTVEFTLLAWLRMSCPLSRVEGKATKVRRWKRSDATVLLPSPELSKHSLSVMQKNIGAGQRS